MKKTPIINQMKRGGAEWGEQVAIYEKNHFKNVSAIRIIAKKRNFQECVPDFCHHYPKYLLTLDDVFAGENYNGVIKLNVLDWLLN